MDAFAASFQEIDEKVLSAAKSLQAGTISVDKFQQIVKSSASKTLAFSNVLKSAAVNMGAMLVATLAIQGIAWVFDKLNITIEEQEEVIDGLTDKLSGLKDEYDELSSKDKLIYEEEQKLDKYRLYGIMSARKQIHYVFHGVSGLRKCLSW